MTMRTYSQRESGYSLIEMLGYIAVLAVVINLSVSLFISTTRLSANVSLAFDRIEGIEEIREEFTSIVHEASSISPGVASYVTSEDRLVLVLPPLPGEEGASRFAILGELKGDGRFAKLILTARDGVFDTEYLATYGQEFTSQRFTYDTARPEEARLVRLELEVNNEGMKNTIPTINTFAASPRGLGS